jgi:MFS transporter, ACS family, hexuronate transporter
MPDPASDSRSGTLPTTALRADRPGQVMAKRGGFRWTICALLFFATTVNYVDRAVLGVLKPLLDQELGWSQVAYGHVVTAFQFAYALGYVGGGRLMDRIGVRIGFALAVLVWSLAAMAHALARSLSGFSAARAVLGLAEGGGFPAAIKSIAEWFPKEQRAYATGWFNAGSNVGAIVCPLLVPWLAAHWGWQGAFIATGALGLGWIILWWWLYDAPERHRKVSAEELAYIRKDPPETATHIPWLRLLRCRQTWAFVVGMAASSPIWWFYIYWIPDFLNKRFGLSLTQSSVPLMLIFLGSSFGGIGGGWLSSALIRNGRSVNAARKIALLACALCVVPVAATPFLANVWAAVLLVGLAAAAHCGFAANLFTLVSDTVPRRAISSVVGLGGMGGALAGMVFAQVVSRILQWTHNNYLVPFAYASLVYLAAVGLMHWILPRLEPIAESRFTNRD